MHSKQTKNMAVYVRLLYLKLEPLSWCYHGVWEESIRDAGEKQKKRTPCSTCLLIRGVEKAARGAAVGVLTIMSRVPALSGKERICVGSLSDITLMVTCQGCCFLFFCFLNPFPRESSSYMFEVFVEEFSW